MGKSIYTICLDLQNVDSQVTMYAKQGDTDRTIHFTLRDGGKAFELKDTDIAVLSTITPGGKTIEESVGIKSGTAVYEFSEYLTASVGAMNVEVRIYSEGKNIITASFTLVVEARNGVAKSVTEQDSFTALDQVYARANKAIEGAQIATLAANKAGNHAIESAEVANEAAEVANEAAEHAERAAYDATQAAESANNAVMRIEGAIEDSRDATLFAQSAGESANESASNAEEKACLASDAAQFANTEAQGAIVAAQKAYDAAERANDAIDRLENEGLDIDKSLFANAITDSKSGEIVVLTDVSPFEHTLDVKARSKNALDQNNPVKAQTNSKGEGWMQEDGSWIGYNAYYMQLCFGVYRLTKGQSVTISFDVDAVGSNGCMLLGTSLGTSNILSKICGLGKNTFTYTATDNIDIYVTFTDYETSGNFVLKNIMLCYGTDSEYTPYIDVTSTEPTYTVTSSNEQYVTITDADLFVQKTKEAGVKYKLGEEVVFALNMVTDDVPYSLTYNGNKIMDVYENYGLDFPDLTNGAIYITVLCEDKNVYVQRYGKSLFDFEYKVMQASIHRIDSKNTLIPIQNRVFTFSIDKLPAEFGLHIEYADGSVKPLTIGYGAVKYFFKFDGEVLRLGNNSSCGATKNLDGKVKRFGFWAYGQSSNGWDTEPLAQVELNTEPTEYEPYTEPTTYPINPDGTVEGVTSIYPTTTLIPDTEGVVLDVGYIVDTKKYIDKIKAELQALILGG